MKTPDNQRIKLLISWLVTQGYATNQEDLGCKLGVISKSYLSQLVNGKANNEEFINKLSGVDSRINANWVRTGEGEMLRDNTPKVEKEPTADMLVPASVWQVIQNQAESLKMKDAQTSELIELLKEQMKKSSLAERQFRVANLVVEEDE